MISPDETVASALVNVGIGGGLIVIVGMLALLAQRWRTAIPARRRALAPVVLTASGALLLLGGALVAQAVAGGVADVVWLLALGALATVPFGFLFGLLRGRLAGATVGRLLAEVPDNPSPRDVQAGLRRALRDPSLRLALWKPDGGGYVDVDGRPFELPPDGVSAVTTKVEYEDRPVAALVHDPRLRDAPDLLDSVVAVARIALERDLGLQALRISESRNRALLNAIPDLMFRIRYDGTYLAYKADSSGDLAAPPEELIGSNIHDVLPADVAERIMRCAREALQRGSVQTVDYQLTLEGATRDFEARVVPSGEDEVLLIVRDFTERNRDEAELRRLRDELRARLEELRASRARIVEAGDEARRQLERNLHDGAQQRLVSLSLALRLAQAKLRSDPDEADRIVSEAREELGLALDDLRELARGIHPAVLTERGLEAALQALAARSPISVELNVPPERLPAPVEAAAYYVASEALANVVKYARASAAAVRVTRKNGRVAVEVVDDGVGGADEREGTGLRGLVDRVEALDGSLTVESPPGAGTCIRAEIPLRSPVV